MDEVSLSIIKNNHPHIAAQLQFFQGNKEIVAYIDELVYLQSHELRNGFSITVLNALQTIRDQQSDLLGIAVNCPWQGKFKS